MVIPHLPKNKSPPPNSVVDMAQTGEGAYFDYAVYLKYKHSYRPRPVVRLAVVARLCDVDSRKRSVHKYKIMIGNG